MKHLKKRLIGSIVVLLVFTGVLGIALFHTYQAINQSRYSKEGLADIRAIQKTAHKALDLYRQASESVDHAKAELSAVTYRNDPDSEFARKPSLLPGGAVIRVEGEMVTVPDGFPRDLKLNAGMFAELSGIATIIPDEAARQSGGSPAANGETPGDRMTYYVYYSQIDEPFYYIEWKDRDLIRQEKLSCFDIYESLGGIEKIYNANFVMFDVSGIEKAGPNCKYSSRDMKPYVDAMEKKAAELLKSNEAGFDPEIPRMVELEGVSYRLYVQQNDALQVVIAYLFPLAQNNSAVTEQTVFLMAVFLFICAVYLVWFLSVVWVVRNHSLNDRQKIEFRPKRIKRVSRAFVILGGLVILAAAILGQCLFRLYDKYEQVGDTINLLYQKIDEYEIQKNAAKETKRKAYEECAESIAELLGDHPHLRTPEQLQAYCDILGTDYLMLFDKDGRETVTNSEYRGLSLSTTPADSSHDFRRLLAGVPVISHDVEPEAIS